MATNTTKIFTTQNWRLTLDTNEDQSTASAMEILAKRPDGTIDTFAATIDGGDNNRIYYDVQVSEVAVKGDWTFWAKTTIGGNIAPGDPVQLRIYEEGAL